MFLDFEITKLKKLKIWYFSKGVIVHGFCQKYVFIFGKISQQNVFDDNYSREGKGVFRL